VEGATGSALNSSSACRTTCTKSRATGEGLRCGGKNGGEFEIDPRQKKGARRRLGLKALGFSASIFATDLSKKKEMDAVWTEFFGGDLPARATVGVADLGGGALIEVVVTALKG
jgi:endoribonuclease L-PSP